ncbi:hypothetical protein CAL26_01495 [Bordetella genomosp. 9]|uniref:Pilus assembly protein PilP n=1 Tax=Bordetella genomosp. 9 TaxID=1416803 RepID=A0A261RM85_9BORD|nr:hypothetical protein [Bordetella genomosp. 9]OZI26055.1 hypothetical protein CAL26_01495 [Bordetella genomosp. 9]
MSKPDEHPCLGHRQRKGFPLLALALLYAGYAHASNLDVPPAPPAAPESRLVRELLEVDAQRALDAEKRIRQDARQVANVPAHSPFPSAASAPTASASPTPNAPPSSPKEAPIPRLKGIVGVGGRLSAIVTADGQDTIYRAGRAAPFAGRDPGLRLMRIASPCADFLDTRNRAVAICVNGVHE